VVYEVRPLTPEDQIPAWKLGSIAFGYHDRPMPEDWKSDIPGRYTLGAFDGAGRLVAKAVDRAQEQWFGGRAVATSGVAGVAVAPELRGKGLARLVLTRLLAAARDRGAAISTLFPTVPFPYRRLGWEEAGSLTYLALPTSALAGVRPSPDVALRAATEGDVPAIKDLYRSVARAGTALMERSGPLFDRSATEILESFDGVTVAVTIAGEVIGYASWERGAGYHAESKITAYDLIGSTREATSTLLAMFAGWASVAPTTILRLSTADPALYEVATSSIRIESQQPWMIRVVDAAAAIAGRGWPAHLKGSVDLDLSDLECPWNEGRVRLVLDSGQAQLEPGGSGEVRLNPRGLGVWYAGAASPAVLRRAGFLSGGDDETDAFLAAATAGPAPALLDYF